MDLSWLPDWRNESDYPAPDELPLRLWAWEFLRRNPEFQKDVDRIPVEFFKIIRTNFLKWLSLSEDKLAKAIKRKRYVKRIFFFMRGRVMMNLQKIIKEDSNDETPFKSIATKKSAAMAGPCKSAGKEWAEPGRVLSPT